MHWINNIIGCNGEWKILLQIHLYLEFLTNTSLHFVSEVYFKKNNLGLGVVYSTVSSLNWVYSNYTSRKGITGVHVIRFYTGD